MNIEHGAKVLQTLAKNGLVRTPEKLVTFRVNALPDFEDLYGQSPFTLVVGESGHGWYNASAAAEVHKIPNWVDHDMDTSLGTVKKIGIHVDEVQEFLFAANSGLYLVGDFPSSLSALIGVSYAWYDPDKADSTFYGAIQREENHFNHNIQFDDGHKNGWNFVGERRYQGSTPQLDDATEQRIVSQAEEIFSTVENLGGTLFNKTVMYEGHMMKDGVLPEPMFIDIYMHKGDKMPNDLDHISILKQYQLFDFYRTF